MPLREDLKNFIPKFLWTTINHPQGYVVSAEEFNSQWNLNVAQGDHTALTVQQLLTMLYETILSDTDGAVHIKVDLPAFSTDNLRQVLVLIDQRLTTNANNTSTAMANAAAAVATSNTANNTANTANSNSVTATNTANSAVVTANVADGKADAAVITANAASAKATQVETDFNTLEPILNQAVADANQAVADVAEKASVAYVNSVANNFQLGVVFPDSITEAQLHPDVKVGSLATLTTTDKTSVTAAVNEIVGDLGSLDTALNGRIDTLLIEVEGTSTQETALVYTGSNLTNVKEYWTDGITLKTDTTLTYTGSNLTGVTTLRYNDVGVLLTTTTETLVYTGSNLTSVERVVS